MLLFLSWKRNCTPSSDSVTECRVLRPVRLFSFCDHRLFKCWFSWILFFSLSFDHICHWFLLWIGIGIDTMTQVLAMFVFRNTFLPSFLQCSCNATDFFYELGLGLVQILIMFVSWILSIQCCFMNTQYNSSHSWKKKTGWHQQLVSLAFIWISYKLYTVFVLASMTRTIVYINNK